MSSGSHWGVIWASSGIHLGAIWCPPPSHPPLLPSLLGTIPQKGHTKPCVYAEMGRQPRKRLQSGDQFHGGIPVRGPQPQNSPKWQGSKNSHFPYYSVVKTLSQMVIHGGDSSQGPPSQRKSSGKGRKTLGKVRKSQFRARGVTTLPLEQFSA